MSCVDRSLAMNIFTESDYNAMQVDYLHNLQAGWCLISANDFFLLLLLS